MKHIPRKRFGQNFLTDQLVLHNIIRAIASDATAVIEKTTLLSEAERHRQLIEWNATRRWYPQEKCIHELFEEQAEQTPDRIALVHEGGELTYAELNRRANRLADRLIERGVGPEVRVGLCLERSAEMVIGMVGILKAGGAYVPLDPEYPEARLEYVLGQSGCRLVLSEQHLMMDLPLLSTLKVLPLDARLHGALFGAHSEENVDVTGSGVGPGNLAYVIYTSGSTGAPKGVMVSHRGLCNLARAQIAEFEIQESSRVLQFASLSFDASASEITTALCSGATLCLPAGTQALAGEWVLGTLAEGISHVTLPPALLATLTEHDGLEQLAVNSRIGDPVARAGAA